MSTVDDGSKMVRVEDAISPKNRRKLPDVSLTALAHICLGTLTALTLYGLSHLQYVRSKFDVIRPSEEIKCSIKIAL